jgi:hypothetical protein
MKENTRVKSCAKYARSRELEGQCNSFGGPLRNKGAIQNLVFGVSDFCIERQTRLTM